MATVQLFFQWKTTRSIDDIARTFSDKDLNTLKERADVITVQQFLGYNNIVTKKIKAKK